MKKPATIIALLTGIIVFLGLYLLVSYLILKQNNEADFLKIKDVLNSKHQVFYGQTTDKESENAIHIKLDELGEAALMFETGTFEASDYSALEFSIHNLPSNYRPYLIWRVKNDKEIYQVKLVQSLANKQLNILNTVPGWNGQVVQFGVKIIPQHQLGLILPYDGIIKIDAFELRQFIFAQDYMMLFNYWWKYEPWEHHSINNLNAIDFLPPYAQPIMFFMIWFFVCVSIQLVIYRKLKYVIPLVLFCWLLLDLMQLNNLSKISNWTQEVYDDELKIHKNEDLYKIAQKVKELLGLYNDKLIKLKKNKVLVLSSDRYERSRVIYHLLPINSSYLDVNNEDSDSIVNKGDFILSMSLNRNPARPIDGILLINDKDVHVKEVGQDEFISIMEVIK